MIRIGIIGTENSHAMGFAKLINVSGRYPRLKVVSLYGEDPQASLKVQQECGVETIAPNPQAMLGQIDALMVTSRDGALHAKYAAPFLKAGIPAFIDKPFTRDCAEARELVALAEANDAKIMGGSGVKFVPDVLTLREFAQQNAPIGGHVWAPVSMENEYGNFYFYCAHLVESCMMIFGYDPVSVSAHRNAKGVSAVVRYPSFDVHLSFLDNIYHYGASVLTATGAMSKEINIDVFTELLLQRFADMLESGTLPQPYHELISPVDLMVAIHKSFSAHREQLL